MAYHYYALLALGCLLSYVVITKITAYIKVARFSKAKGCKPVTKLPQSETIVGWRFSQQAKQQRANKEFLEAARQRLLTYGHTYQITVMGNTFITTDEPENIKALLATNFKDFGLGKRLEAFGPQFGSGIFTTDGAHWEHSRVLYLVHRQQK
jgi:hypothetical protein